VGFGYASKADGAAAATDEALSCRFFPRGLTEANRVIINITRAKTLRTGQGSRS